MPPPGPRGDSLLQEGEGKKETTKCKTTKIKQTSKQTNEQKKKYLFGETLPLLLVGEEQARGFAGGPKLPLRSLGGVFLLAVRACR